MARNDRKGKSQTPDEAHQRLTRVTKALRLALTDADRGYIYLDEQDAAWLAVAFETFLDGTRGSLDAALGVKRGRGAPKRGPSNDQVLELVGKAMWRGSKSWKEISDETGIDPRYLQRLVSRHEQAAIKKLANELVKQMNSKDQRATKPNPDDD